MIPRDIQDYLSEHQVPARTVDHPRAVSAQKLAAALDVSGFQVAKTVVFEANQEQWLAVLPAPFLLDLDRVRDQLGGAEIRLLEEKDFGPMFPGCELGAEPPFGRLYGLPVLVDRALAAQGTIAVRAGSHEQCLLMKYSDFEQLERPGVAEIGRLPDPEAKHAGQAREAELDEGELYF
jgi:Ala-tRNA(Pro) deacylase